MLATSQQSIEMRMALANAEKRSGQYAAQLKRIDDLVEKNDRTFYHCLPKEISDKMQRGGSYLDGCGVFESVTMLYASNYFRYIHKFISLINVEVGTNVDRAQKRQNH